MSKERKKRENPRDADPDIAVAMCDARRKLEAAGRFLALEAYQGRMVKALPDDARVSALKRVVEGEHPMATLKAVMYVDRALGLVAEEAAAQPAAGPMFTLPPGTRVAIITPEEDEPHRRPSKAIAVP